MKRLLDIMLSAPALLLAAPLMLAVALAIRWRMGRPVLFRQQRPGLHGQSFTLYKFRTMRGGSAPDGQRLTPLGHWLRRFSLDELPQLFNVLKGDMSLVGPRPLLVEYLDVYTSAQARRHEVKPGLTGWAQVHGRNALPWSRRLALDVWYVDHRSLWLDVRILARTAWHILHGRGVRQPGHATVERLTSTAEPSTVESPTPPSSSPEKVSSPSPPRS